MDRRTREATGPNDDPKSSRERDQFNFSFHAEDPHTLSELRSIPAGRDRATRWIACCLRSTDFQAQLDLRVAELRNQGWDLVRVEGVEESTTGVTAKLVVEQRKTDA